LSDYCRDNTLFGGAHGETAKRLKLKELYQHETVGGASRLLDYRPAGVKHLPAYEPVLLSRRFAKYAVTVFYGKPIPIESVLRWTIGTT
jgi:hypothetical protein